MAKKKNQAYGTCKHCGQQIFIHLPEDWDPKDYDPDEYDRMATEQCECAASQADSKRNEQKAKALKRMTEYYDELIKVTAGDTDRDKRARERLERQQGLMLGVICCVLDSQIAAAHIATSESEAFSVVIKAKGDLQIKRTFKGSEEWIF